MSPSELPSGTVTFLYTDVEGSAALWEQDPDGMRASTARHDEILHDTITANGGHVYKVIGDAFQASFALPLQAVMAAVDVQRRLAATNWGTTGPLRVRIGLHTGDGVAMERDYATTHTLNRVARIMSAGFGGQILVSDAVAELVRGALPADVTLHDMGQHRLKGLTQSERLYQVVVPDLPQDFPPLATIDVRPNNLPVQVTPFVGREKEIVDAKQLLSSARLLTITGPGGMGKTRLAMQVAAELLEEHPDGVWLVELAPLSDPSQMPNAIASAIGLQEQEGSQMVDLLLSYLERKTVLLVLDNCEHLVDACAQLAHTLLRAVPRGRILATSRQPLNLTGEHVFSLGGMEIPEREGSLNGRHYAAVQLFEQGARRATMDFELRREDLGAVVRICRLLQGMPLGILLAAAWVDVLPMDEIAVEIEKNVDFLETEMRDIPERQRSVRAVFEYSWNLLSEAERAAFARMSVFRGGFDRQAALTIADASIRMLNTLVNKSLIEKEAEKRRFSIHELIRQFAERQLEISSDADAIRDEHCRHYLTYLAGFEPDLKGRRQLDALDEIEADFDNIRTAWKWAVAHHDPELVGGALESLFLFTAFRSHLTEGYELFKEARTQWPTAGEPVPDLAGRLSIRYPDRETPPEMLYERGLEIARQGGDQAEIAFALNQLGRYLAHSFSDPGRGMSLMAESLELYQKMGDDYREASVLDDIAFGYSLMDQEQRMSYGKRSLAIRRRIGDQIGVVRVLRNLSVAAAWLGRTQESNAYLEEALPIARRSRDWNGIAWMLSLRAEMSFVKGQFTESKDQLDEAYSIALEINDRDLIRNCLIVRSVLAAVVDGDLSTARDLLTEVYPPGAPIDMLWWAHTVKALVATSMGDHDEAERSIRVTLRGMQQSGISLAGWSFFVPILALALYQHGDFELSARCLGFFDSLPREAIVWSERWPLVIQLRKDLESKLDDQTYQDALAQGRSLDVDTIAAIFGEPSSTEGGSFQDGMGEV